MTLRLIEHFWDVAILACRAVGSGQLCVCRVVGNYGAQFKAYRGVTLGGPLSPLIFNVMDDVIVRVLHHHKRICLRN